MKGDSTIRKISDIDEETLSYEEIKAIASGNPKILEKVKIDTRVNELQLLKGQFNKKKYSIQYNIRDSKQQIEYFKTKTENVQKDISTRDSNNNDDFSININNNLFANKEDAGKEILNYFNYIHVGDEINIGKYKEFDISCTKEYYFNDIIKIINIKGYNKYRVNIINRAKEVIERLDKAMDNFEEKLTKYQEKVTQNQLDLENYKKQANEKFKYDEELEKLLIKQSELNSELCLDNKEVIIGEEE